MKDDINVEAATLIDREPIVEIVPQAVGDWVILEAIPKRPKGLIEIANDTKDPDDYWVYVQSKGLNVGNEIPIGARVTAGSQMTFGTYTRGGERLFTTVHKEAITAILNEEIEADA